MILRDMIRCVCVCVCVNSQDFIR